MSDDRSQAVPFCGGEAEARDGSSTTPYIRCKSCGCRTGSSWDMDKLKAAWNRRAERACSIGYEYEGEPFFHAIHVHELTCGHDVRLFEDVPRYCPYCGAKVLGEIDGSGGTEDAN